MTRVFVQTHDDVMSLLGALTILQYKTVVVDTETNGLDAYHGNRIIGLSLYFPDTDESFYVPVRHNNDLFQNIGFDWYRKILVALSLVKHHIYFNAKFDLHMLVADEMTLPERITDVMLAAQLLNENEWLSHGKKEGAYTLKRLAAKYLGDWATEGEDKLKEIAKSHGVNPKSEMYKIPEVDIVANYAMQDVEITWKLLEFYMSHLEKWNQVALLDQRSEFELKVLFRMEYNGVRIDKKRIKELQSEIEPRMAEIQAEFDLYAGKIGKFDKNGIINLNSPKQLLAFFPLIGVLLRSTDKAALELSNNDWAKKLLEYRTLAKANGTYYQPYLTGVDSSGFVHPSFNAIGTVSGRLSSNFQQIPRKGKHKVKSVIIPRKGNVLVQSDYAQLELRLAVHFAKENKMLEMFHNGTDLHQYTADQLGIDRYAGKTLNFGLLYGMQGGRASVMLGMDKDKAQELVNGWNKLYPAFKKASRSWQRLAETRRDSEGKEGGKYQFIRLFNGRVRHFQEYERYGYQGETRTAWNNLVQGTGAAVAEMSMLDVCKEFPDNSWFIPLLTVHDSFMYEVPSEMVKETAQKVDYVMTSWPQFDPKLAVDTKWTKESWYDLV